MTTQSGVTVRQNLGLLVSPWTGCRCNSEQLSVSFGTHCEFPCSKLSQFCGVVIARSWKFYIELLVVSLILTYNLVVFIAAYTKRMWLLSFGLCFIENLEGRVE